VFVAARLTVLGAAITSAPTMITGIWNGTRYRRWKDKDACVQGERERESAVIRGGDGARVTFSFEIIGACIIGFVI